MIQYNITSTTLRGGQSKYHDRQEKNLSKYYHYNLNGQTKDESFKTRDEENNYINNKICSTTKNILMNIR